MEVNSALCWDNKEKQREWVREWVRERGRKREGREREGENKSGDEGRHIWGRIGKRLEKINGTRKWANKIEWEYVSMKRHQFNEYNYKIVSKFVYALV